jgi:ATP-dependent Clp protease ATP-binding subunit ClpX
MIKLRGLRCSFCGKNETEVLKLVAGPRVYICDKCVTIASQIISDPHSQSPHVKSSMWSKLMTRARQVLNRGDSHQVSSF